MKKTIRAAVAAQKEKKVNEKFKGSAPRFMNNRRFKRGENNRSQRRERQIVAD